MSNERTQNQPTATQLVGFQNDSSAAVALTESEAVARAIELGLERQAEEYLGEVITAHSTATELSARLPRSFAYADEPSHVFKLKTGERK